MAQVFPETIIIIGRCSRNVFLAYIMIQVSDLSKGISGLVATTKDFYTISE